MLEDKAAAGIHPKYIPPGFEPGLRAPLAKASYTFQARTLTKLRGGAVSCPPLRYGGHATKKIHINQL